ncbi:MAG: GntR family transcriptional regulator [Spirochaetaceae bacterium]|nr:GntR family transcriptional regulator [Spirochaetaceae bacterium]
MKINRSPLYQQLNTVLRKLIEEDRYSVGDKFLTERTICEHYQVSRATANKALSSLVSEGLLEFKKGVGTFIISKPETHTNSPLLPEFPELAKEIGKSPTALIRGFEIINAGDIQSDGSPFSEIDGNKKIYFINRLWSVDGIPIKLESLYFDADYCAGLNKKSFRKSLNDLLVNDYNLNIIETVEKISARNIWKRESELLEFTPEQAGFHIVSTSYIEKRTPVFYEKSIYRPGSMVILNGRFSLQLPFK